MRNNFCHIRLPDNYYVFVLSVIKNCSASQAKSYDHIVELLLCTDVIGAASVNGNLFRYEPYCDTPGLAPGMTVWLTP
jgi:hypothetical protein